MAPGGHLPSETLELVIISALQELGQWPISHFTDKETEAFSRPLGQLMTELRLDIS